MSNYHNSKKIDDFRFIDHLNTQVRSLAICTQILKLISKQQLPKHLVEQKMINWSNAIYHKSEKYRSHRGILTDPEGRPTTAFKHYYEFLNNLGLITILGDFAKLTNTGKLLTLLTIEKKEDEYYLTDKEKIFYLYLLFMKDADGLIFCLNLLHNLRPPISQSDIMNGFVDHFKDRLTTKQKLAISTVKDKLLAKYRNIDTKWKSPKKYSEHIVIPRLEWLSDLHIIDINKNNNKTLYKICDDKYFLYKSFIAIKNGSISDINEHWLQSRASHVFNKVVYQNNHLLVQWNKCDIKIRNNRLIFLIEESYKFFSQKGSLRVSIYPTLIFIIISLASEYGILAEFEEIVSALKNKIYSQNKIYSIHTSARINEGYISIKN